MRFPLAPDVFPRVQFAKQDQVVLQGVAMALVDDTLQQYHAQQRFQAMAAVAARGNNDTARATFQFQPEQHQYQYQRQQRGASGGDLRSQLNPNTLTPYSVDSTQWKLLKHRDNVRVYKERTSFHASRQQQQQQVERNGDQNQSEDFSTNASRQQQPALPMMMAIGSVQGSVDDVMYGLLNHTQAMAQIQASYIGDDVVDSQVLAPLIRPSGSNPLRSLSAKWCAKRHNGIIRSLVRYRDFVFVEATGVTRDRNGERVGYHIIHSITVPGVRELHEMNVVRAKISMCCLFRQRDGNTVELFMRGFLNPLGDVPLRTAMVSAAESVLSMWKTIYCAQMKKLAWELTSATEATQRREARNVDSCGVCWKGLRASLHPMKQCQVCRRHICSRCCVSKKLSFLSPGSSQVIQKTALFCSCCVYKATQTSSLELAVRESASVQDAHSVSTTSPGSTISALSQAPLTTPKSTRSGASSSVASSNFYAPSGYSSAATPSANSRRGGSRLAKWLRG
ncbi:hypothetical protein Gpo141_00003892 [Globisporangium polare]